MKKQVTAGAAAGNAQRSSVMISARGNMKRNKAEGSNAAKKPATAPREVLIKKIKIHKRADYDSVWKIPLKEI